MAEHPVEGLVAPEGTYTLTASLLLPPQPAFMSSTGVIPNVNVSAAASNAANSTANTASTNAGAAAASGQPNGNNHTMASSLSNDGVSNGVSGSTPSHLEAGLQGLHLSNGPDGSEAQPPRTALHHISMQAPSAWSHAPFVPVSRISVASIRPVAVPSTSTIPGVPTLGRRDRGQQQSQASGSAALTVVGGGLDGSAEGSSGSQSDVGLDGSVADVQGSAPYRTGVDGGRADATTSATGMANWGPVLENALAAQGIDGTATHVTGGPGGLPGMSALQLLAHLGTTGGAQAGVSSLLGAAPTGGATGVGGAGGGGRNLAKPRNNVKQNSSSFVQRLQAHSDLTKLLASRADGMVIERHSFISRGRMIFWMGETARGWIREPLMRVTFAFPISSHDVNQHTRSSSRLDVIIAFNTADLIWLEPMSARYSRINKAGCINDSPITSVRWVPSSETLFLTTHADGTCTLFDVTRDDSTAGSWTPVSALSLNEEVRQTPQVEEDQEVMLTQAMDGERSHDAGGLGLDSIRAWDPHGGILVTRPGLSDNETTKKTWSKLNPVAHWRVTRNASITDVAFSPDHSRLAITTSDGTLRLLNLLTESLEGTFESYYGGINRVVWSPDARFLLTAGCDDLISVWTADGRLLSRCPGHSSFVTGLAFDPWKWRVEDRTYRFVSVGEDGKVFLWDFSSAALHRPRLPHSAQSNRRHHHPGYRSSSSLPSHHRRTSLAAAEEQETNPNKPPFRRAPPRNEVAELQPVASYQIGPIPGAAQAMSNPSYPANSGDPSVLVSFAPPPAPAVQSNGVGSGAEPPSTPTAGTAGAVNSPSTPYFGLNGASVANEPGAALDLLIDVRCRPDGIVLLHKSGTLRYLRRPGPSGVAVR